LYEPPNKQSLFCSIECKRLGRNARLRRKTQDKLRQLTCLCCGVEFKQNHAEIQFFVIGHAKTNTIQKKKKLQV